MASIERRTTKTGGERFRVIWWQDGQRQQKTFYDADSADQFKEDVETFGNQWPPGTDPRPARPVVALTFHAWAERAIAARTRASDRTRADYRRDLERHFALLNPIPLEILRAEHVIAWMRDRETACRCGRPLADHRRDGFTPPCTRPVGLSEKTRRNLHGFASSLIADALSQHPPLIEHNPFADRLTERAAIRTEDMEFLTPEEFAAVLSWVPDERNYRELLRLLFRTGLRYGEATALTVGDISLLGQRKTLTVTKAWKRTGSSQYVIGEPKTRRSRRTLPLSPASVHLLVPLVASRPSKALLFPDTTGGRLSHTEVYKRAWAPAVARANVCDTHYAEQRDGRGQPPTRPKPCNCAGVLGKVPRIHDIRHSTASMWLAQGIDIAVISKQLGHSSVQITIDRYSHLSPAVDAMVTGATDRALAATSV